MLFEKIAVLQADGTLLKDRYVGVRGNTIVWLSDKPPVEVLRTVRGAVDSFVRDAEQFDDLTMLCLEYREGNVNA